MECCLTWSCRSLLSARPSTAGSANAKRPYSARTAARVAQSAFVTGQCQPNHLDAQPQAEDYRNTESSALSSSKRQRLSSVSSARRPPPPSPRRSRYSDVPSVLRLVGHARGKDSDCARTICWAGVPLDRRQRCLQPYTITRLAVVVVWHFVREEQACGASRKPFLIVSELIVKVAGSLECHCCSSASVYLW